MVSSLSFPSPIVTCFDNFPSTLFQYCQIKNHTFTSGIYLAPSVYQKEQARPMARARVRVTTKPRTRLKDRRVTAYLSLKNCSIAIIAI